MILTKGADNIGRNMDVDEVEPDGGIDGHEHDGGCITLVAI